MNTAPSTAPAAPGQWYLHSLYVLLLASVLANGLLFWLQRTELMGDSPYRDFQETVRTLPQSEWQEDYDAAKSQLFRDMYAVTGPWILTKLLKDLFFFTFIVASLLFWRQVRGPGLAPLAVPIALAFVAGAALLHSLFVYGAWVALLGLRPFAFMLVVFFGAWAATRPSLELLSRYLFAVLLVQLALAIFEAIHGVPLFFSLQTGNRATGTFLLPVSLGVFAVVTYVLAGVVTRLPTVVLLFPVVPVVYLSGSGTAFVLLGLAFAVQLYAATPRAWQPAAGVTLLAGMAVLFLALPTITSRPDIISSLAGRAEIVVNQFQQPPSTFEFLFGKGLGVGSNVVHSAIGYLELQDTQRDLPDAFSDSTVMALFHQLGVTGLLLFYAMLGLAAWRDPELRAFYLVLVLAGMTVNLLEFFPVNFLLGLLLARSLLRRRPSDPALMK